jgi:hypothetical protein
MTTNEVLLLAENIAGHIGFIRSHAITSLTHAYLISANAYGPYIRRTTYTLTPTPTTPTPINENLKAAVALYHETTPADRHEWKTTARAKNLPIFQRFVQENAARGDKNLPMLRTPN